jgi:hypothetical protein
MLNQTSDQKYAIEYPFGNILVTISNRKKVSGALVGWILMWLAVFPALVYVLLSNMDMLTGLNLLLTLVFLAVFIFRVFPAFPILALQLARESLDIDPQAVKVHSKVFGIDRTREFLAEDITSISANTPKMRSFAFLKYGLASFEVQATGPIVLVHKGKEVRLGYGLDFNDGQTIVNSIHERFQKYK